MQAVELHAKVAAAVNAGDVEELVSLYEPGAGLVNEDGSVTVSQEAVKETATALMSLGGRMDITTRFAIEMGDLALMSNEWHFTSDDVELSGITAEVARRQPNGTWLYVIDNPYALAFPVS